MDCSTPCFPGHHQFLELTQTHVHRVSDAIQTSHLLVPFSFHLQSLPASRSFPVSQFFTSGGPSIGASASASATVHPGGIQATSYLWLSTRCLAQCRFHGWCTTSVGINIEKLYYFYSMKYSVDPHGLKNRVYFPWCDTSSQ